MLHDPPMFNEAYNKNWHGNVLIKRDLNTIRTPRSTLIFIEYGKVYEYYRVI